LNEICWGFDTSDKDALWDISFGTKTFDLVTLTLNFDLVLKKTLIQNFNLDYIFWTKRVTALILGIHMHYEETFSYKDFWPCDLDLELWPSFEKKYNLYYIFKLNQSTSALILEI
jgi:hypothetical protein